MNGQPAKTEEDGQGITFTGGMHPAVEIGETYDSDRAGHKEEATQADKKYGDDVGDIQLNLSLSFKIAGCGQSADEIEDGVDHADINKHGNPFVEKTH